jgi:hypothetical protein
LAAGEFLRCLNNQIMKSKWLLGILYLFMPLLGYTQWHDNYWMTGYNLDATQIYPGFGITQIRFDENEPVLEAMEWNFFDFYLTQVVMSDSSGNLAFYFNGIDVWNAQHQLMENGEWLNTGWYAENWKEYGYPLTQGAIGLPFPGHPNQYCLFYGTRIGSTDDLDIHMDSLYYSVVEMNDNAPLGEIVEKQILLLSDTLDVGRITATKHANGRDWWITVAEFDRVAYYTFLLDPTGLQLINLQEIHPGYQDGKSGVGESRFSPDGTYFSRHILNNTFNYVELFHFERCTGTLSNYQRIDLPELACQGGVAFSHNSRYVYIPSCLYVYRLDLWATDIEASLEVIAEYDGFVSIAETYFKAACLAPDGKIYINTPSGSDRYHIIHRPNDPNPQIEQHALELLTINFRSIPNNPYYRLGPLDGSPCDTLGLDNHPLARFTYFDTSLTVSFMEVSSYEPTSWQWDFGDGQSSLLPNPVHTYADTGTYHVCLTVSNANSSDTFCRWITVQELPSSTTQLTSENILRVHPNPASTAIHFTLPWEGNAQIAVLDITGQVRQTHRGVGAVTLDVSALPSGYYYLVVEQGGQRAACSFVVTR